MKKRYTDPRIDCLFLSTTELLMESGELGEDDYNKDDEGNASPGWNGEEIELPPMPL